MSSSVRRGLARATDSTGALPLGQVVAVAERLLSHSDLDAVLAEIVAAAQGLFGAELAALWTYAPERNELTCAIPPATPPVAIALGVGLVGYCGETRQVVNVPDVAADKRFDPAIDGAAQLVRGSMLNLPMVDSGGALVGVLQLLDEDGLPFDAPAIAAGQLLAALAAVSLQALKRHARSLEYQRLQQEVDLARNLQISTLPQAMPQVPGYDVYGHFQPAEQAGGDLYDLVLLDGRLFVLLGDATGHGFGPALSATQMQAMLRVAFRLGADLDQAFRHVNNQLAEDLPPDRFLTAFMGFLEPAAHVIRYHAAGQGPILHFHASAGRCDYHEPDTFPVGIMALDAVPPATVLELAPGDILALISDGVYEQPDPGNEEFGRDRVAAALQRWHALPLAELCAKLLAEVVAFAAPQPQADDITLVVVRRLPG